MVFVACGKTILSTPPSARNTTTRASKFLLLGRRLSSSSSSSSSVTAAAVVAVFSNAAAAPLRVSSASTRDDDGGGGGTSASTTRSNPHRNEKGLPLLLPRSYSLLSTRRSGFSTAASTAERTTTTAFDKIGCVGLGLMGHGICQVAATAAAAAAAAAATTTTTTTTTTSIVAFEREEIYLTKGRDRIAKSIETMVKKGKMTHEIANDAMNSIEFTTDPSGLADADFVVEAVVEDLALKKSLWETLGNACQPSTIFASNTSSLSIGEMAKFSGRPERFLGVHFFNPVQIMKVVEVVRTDQTDQKCLNRVLGWVKEIGKTPVLCGDTPGFIVNRILVPMLMQSLSMIDRKDATVRDVDNAMKLGCGHPMGPIHLADYIGLDTCYFIVRGWMEKHPNEPDFFIPDCLQAKVEAGDLGRKTGKGFYHWRGDKIGDPVLDEE